MKFLTIFIFIFCSVTVAEDNHHHDHHQHDHDHNKEKKKHHLDAHQHGLSVLNIAQENDTIIFEFEMPGFDIVGFEYKAKKKEDVKKTRQSINLLKDYNNMLTLTEEAECENTTSSSDVLYEGSHSEFISKYAFKCSNIKNLNKIKINFFGTFANSKKLNINIVTANVSETFETSKNKNIINVENFF